MSTCKRETFATLVRLTTTKAKANVLNLNLSTFLTFTGVCRRYLDKKNMRSQPNAERQNRKYSQFGEHFETKCLWSGKHSKGQVREGLIVIPPLSEMDLVALLVTH